MALFKKIILLALLSVAMTADELVNTTKKASSRSSRKYDTYYNSIKFPDDSASTDSPEEQPIYTDAGTGLQPKGDKEFSDKTDNKNLSPKFPGYSKGYWIPPQNYKGFPYSPYYTGSFEDDFSEDQLMEMMMMMNAVNKLQGVPKKEEPGLLSQLLSEPKAVILAAAIPLTILLFSFAPLVMNYFQASSNSSFPTTISTIANSKMGRALTDKEFLDSTVENLSEVVEKILNSGECVQQAVCETAIKHGGMKHMKQIATIVLKMGKKEWLSSFHAKHLMDGLEQGDCSNVCHTSSRHRKHQNKQP